MALVGEKLEDYVWKQINTRQQYLGSRNKDDNNLLFFNAKTSWVKLASGVSITSEKLKLMGYSEQEAQNLEGMNLAKNHILFNGISRLDQNNNLTQREGLRESNSIFSSYDSTRQFGIVPMPGIESVSIKCLNRGSLEKAKIQLKVQNYIQLQIIDVLYLRLGYTMLLEWGNSIYLKNQVVNEPIELIKAPSTFLEKKFFNNSLSKNKSYLDILPALEKERKESYANYDGFIGKVSNFNWSFNDDGSYDVDLELISLGDVIESLKSNTVLDEVSSAFIEDLGSNASTALLNNLDNVINSYRNSNTIFSLLYLYKYNNSVPPVITNSNTGTSNFDPSKALCLTVISGSTTATNWDGDEKDENNYFIGDICSPGTSTLSTALQDVKLSLTLGFNRPGQSNPIFDAYNYVYGPFSGGEFTDRKYLVLFPNPVTINMVLKNATTDKLNLPNFVNEIAGFSSPTGNPNFVFEITGDSNGSTVKKYFTENWDIFKRVLTDIFKSQETIKRFFSETSNRRFAGSGVDDVVEDLTKQLAEYSQGKFAPFVLQNPDRSLVSTDEEANDYQNARTTPLGSLYSGERFSKHYINTGGTTVNVRSNQGRSLGFGNAGSVNSSRWNSYQRSIASKRVDRIKGNYTFTSNRTYEGSALPNPLVDLQKTVYGDTSNKVDVIRLFTKSDNKSTFTFYIRFKHLLDMIKENVLSRIDTKSSTYSDNPNIVGINTQDDPTITTGKNRFISKMKYKTGLTSYDPLVCIVQSTIYPDRSKTNSYINTFLPNNGEGRNSKGIEKWVIDTQTANSMNIYLNFNFVGGVLESNLDPKGNLSVYSFIQGICTGINKSLAGVNNLEPVIDKTTNILSIVDTSKNNSKTSPDYEINPFGFVNNNTKGSFVRKVDLKTAITPQYATMVTVGATAGGYVKGTEATAFSRWNKGIIDRFKTELLPASKNSSAGGTIDEQIQDIINVYYTTIRGKSNLNFFGSPINAKINIQDTSSPLNPIDINKYDVTGEISFSDDLITQNIDVATEYYKAYPAYNLRQGKDDGGNIGFIPFNIGLKLDGISGIKIYNQVQLSTRFLPPNYSNSLNFIVTGIDHSLKNGDWETNLKLTLIPKPHPEDATPSTSNIIYNNNPPAPTPTSTTGGNYWLGTESQFVTREIRSITIHITAGGGTAQRVVKYVNRKDHPFRDDWGGTNGIHYAVDRTGTSAAGIPEGKRCVHGDNWNDHGVGIEIVTYGALKKKGGKFVTKPAYLKNTVVPDSEVVDLGFEWEGTQFYQDYTDVEIAGVKTLIQGIISRNPKIQDGITGQSVWKKVFGLPAGKPSPGDSIAAVDASEYGGYKQFGIFSHTTGGGTHSDPFPSPKMINMLKSLGYVD